MDRNGTDPMDWSGAGLQSTSPRKEYSSHGRGTSLESWRRIRSDNDDGQTPLEQWRSGSLTPREPTKWGERSGGMIIERITIIKRMRYYIVECFKVVRQAGAKKNLEWVVVIRGATSIGTITVKIVLG